MSTETLSTRYFTYADDSSNKFWSIARGETSYTVCYGRIGTAGQTQQKHFESAEACREAAGKLIAGKLGKGYLEDGETRALPAAGPGTATAKKRPATGQTARFAEAETLDGYQALIERGTLPQLLPFLQSVESAHYPALKKAIKAAQRHYCRLLELPDPERVETFYDKTGYRSTAAQRQLIELSGLALLPISDLKPFNVDMHLHDPRIQAEVDAVLDWVRPAWLMGVLEAQQRDNTWLTMSYVRLRSWEAADILAYEAGLFAHSLANCHVMQDVGEYHEISGRYQEYVLNDETAVRRDLPLLFEYETSMQHASLVTITGNPGERQSFWSVLFRRLLEAGRIDRGWLLASCISVQSKDWNASLRSFLRKEAAALIRKFGAASDGALREKILQYEPGILGNLRSELAPFLEADGYAPAGAIDAEPAAPYRFTPPAPPRLADLAPVHPPATWNELLFAVGTYIASEDPLDMARIIAAVLQPPGDIPADAHGQLDPYHTQFGKQGGMSWIKNFTNSWLWHMLRRGYEPFHDTFSWIPA